MKRFNTYREFWPYYLRDFRAAGEHERVLTGTVVMLFFLVFTILMGNVLFIAIALALACGFRFISVNAGQRVRPLTVTHPLWSLVSDVRLLAIVLLDRLAEEYERYGIR